MEKLVGEAGLRPETAAGVVTTMRFPDEATALRGLIASGVVERAIRNSSEKAVRDSIAEAIRPSRRSDGSYAFDNEWRFLVSRA